MTEVLNREFVRLFAQPRDLHMPAAPLFGRLSAYTAVAKLANHLSKPCFFLHVGSVHVTFENTACGTRSETGSPMNRLGQPIRVGIIGKLLRRKMQ